MEKEILNMDEAAELFGVSVKTFIKLLKEEKVPARKIGREWRFSRSALINWLSSGDSQVYSSSEGEAKEFFNEVAPEWEAISRNYYDESIKNQLIQSNILKKEMTIIDLGSGDGYISRSVARLVKRVIAVDISKEMLKELNKKAKAGGIKNIETIESDGLDIPVEDCKIDVVCANMYLHHIEDPELAVKEMCRVIKSGGWVFLADFHEHSDTSLKDVMHDFWLGFDTEKIKKWFEKSGFKNINIFTVDDGGNNIKSKNINNKKIFVLIAKKA